MPPGGVYRVAMDIAARVLERLSTDDLSGEPDLFRGYFSELFQYVPTDYQRGRECPIQEDREALHFRSVARKAKVIIDGLSGRDCAKGESLGKGTSTRAATAYCIALNAMLGRENHSLRLGQVACCFWTRNETDATSAWGALLNQADPLAVADFLKSPWVGQEREALRQEQFHAVTLAGNSGRIVVRHESCNTSDEQPA